MRARARARALPVAAADIETEEGGRGLRVVDGGPARSAAVSFGFAGAMGMRGAR